MQDEFARIFIASDGEQVLFFTEYDCEEAEGTQHGIVVITKVDSTEARIRLSGFGADEAQDLATAWEKITQTTAENIRMGLKAQMTGGEQ